MRAAFFAALVFAATGPVANEDSPSRVIVATSLGETSVPVSSHRGHAVLPAPTLARVLPVSGLFEDNWAVVMFAGQEFRFLLDAPVMELNGRTVPLVGGAYVVRDTLYVPLQWLAEFVPKIFHEGYRYDPLAARFEETRVAPTITTVAPAGAVAVAGSGAPATDLERENGFRLHHKIVVDAGHGGKDHGNPGLYLPRGVQEKHVALAITKEVRSALERRGIEVVLTRSDDRYLGYAERTDKCQDSCDTFVSIHVNSMPRRRDYQNVRGFMTFFLGVEETEEAKRVAEMENEALRYEAGYAESTGDDPLAFIFKDLQTNEFLRESALLADAVQEEGVRVHPGQDLNARQARFAVLRLATRPAILVETGFATNPHDGEFLASRDGQRRLGEAIAEGIVSYLHEYERRLLGGAL